MRVGKRENVRVGERERVRVGEREKVRVGQRETVRVGERKRVRDEGWWKRKARVGEFERIPMRGVKEAL